MAMVSLRQLLDHAAERDYAIPAFNINNMEQMLAVLGAADRTRSPVIIQASKGARAYANDKVLRRLMQAAVDMYPSLPICLHQDHGPTPAVCESAVENGFTSVMMDGSLDLESRPSSFEYNVGVTSEVVGFAHPAGVSVEGEIGVIGSLETGRGEKEDGFGASGRVEKSRLVTDPDEAARFVAATGLDALAIAIGTSHGAYKFTRRPDGEILAVDIVKKIHDKLPNTALVMHGSSSVPQDLLEEINRYGGDIPETYGVPVEEIQRGIRFGVRKVNVDTDLRLAMTAAIRKVFSTMPAEFDPRKFLKPAMDNMQNVCEQRYVEFGAAGHAGQIKPVPLDEMARRYAAGEYEPIVR
ncbi:MAG: fructose-bisphosphate aldolase class II [Rickettsiales bacterium]|jgi:fructose-bisphosphate aldolase class II|nr:fructose-bisphosphate aldolase class II [Rickettsiales bacterium]